MTAERWEQIEHILDEVMPLEAADRAARLDELCCEDSTLRVQVEEMMGFCEQVRAEAFLEEPPHLAAQDLLLDSMRRDGADAELYEGAVLGPYTIIRALGHGGMGEVYLAERADPHMQVALKIVKRGMDTREILQRFRYEREILARLNHPNIAQLHGGGVTEDGRPYFAMEYVEGTSLEAYCDDKHLAVTERLALFKTVCEAVRYAHRHLVVHRDLKPGNILVSEDEDGNPLVKLLDFGIAKLLEEDTVLHTVPKTQMGALRMTPGYAAPEQVRGQHTTPATDVYALGVILYRLLTGRRPYYFEDRSVTGIESVICRTMPDRPSTVVVRPLRSSGDGASSATPETIGQQRAASPALLRRQLTGDLDAITMMALRKEPERRYPSAAEFLDDIQRYLDSRPVLAQHDSLAYRTTKFVQRHTAGVSIAAAVVVLITALVTFYTIQLAEQRDLANQQRDRALTTQNFMLGTFALADPEAVPNPRVKLDETFTKRDLINASLVRIDELSDPLDRAAVLDVMGQASISFNLFDQADSLYRMALVIKERELGEMHHDVAQSLHGLALALINQGQSQQADSLLRRARDIRRVGAEEANQDLLRNEVDLAYVKLWLNDWPEAEVLYRNALEMVRKIEGPGLSDTIHIQVFKAASLDGLARALSEQGTLDEAEQLYRDALAIRVELLGESHPKTADTMYGLAICLKEKGHLAEAKSYLDEVLNIYRAFYGDQHVMVANTTLVQALLYQQSGSVEAAKSAYLDAIAVYEQALGAEHRWNANPLISFGQFLAENNDADEALLVLNRGLTLLSANSVPETNPLVQRGKRWLGTSLTKLGRFEEAEDVLVANYRVIKGLSDNHEDIQDAVQCLITLYQTWGNPDEVARYRLEASAYAETSKPGNE